MATEYKCDICGNPATVHITKIVDGKKVKIHLCSSCAEKASFDAMKLPAEIFPKIKELEKQIMSSRQAKPEFCPTCSASLSEIENGARFSCPDCYGALGDKLFELFSQMHGATRHAGKSPKFHQPNVGEFDALDKTVKRIEEILGDTCKDFLADAHLLADKLQPKLDNLGNPETTEEVVDFSTFENLPMSEPENPEQEKKESLQKKLDKAISEERYEDAAKIRDEIKSLS